MVPLPSLLFLLPLLIKSLVNFHLPVHLDLKQKGKSLKGESLKGESLKGESLKVESLVGFTSSLPLVSSSRMLGKLPLCELPARLSCSGTT